MRRNLEKGEEGRTGQQGGRGCNSVRVKTDGESWPMRQKSGTDAGNWGKLRFTSKLFNLHFVVCCCISFTIR